MTLSRTSVPIEETLLAHFDIPFLAQTFAARLGSLLDKARDRHNRQGEKA